MDIRPLGLIMPHSVGAYGCNPGSPAGKLPSRLEDIRTGRRRAWLVLCVAQRAGRRLARTRALAEPVAPVIPPRARLQLRRGDPLLRVGGIRPTRVELRLGIARRIQDTL